MSTMKGSRHEGRGGGFGGLPGRLLVHGGRKLPLSLNPREMEMRRMKMRKRGDNSLSPLSAP
jgi:hypothetical protein